MSSNRHDAQGTRPDSGFAITRLFPLASATAVACLTVALALLCGLVTTSPAHAETGISVHVNIGDAPPSPEIVFYSRPHEIYVPETHVYVVDDPHVGDNDCFRYQGYYWVFRGGYWYRASHWRGPFAVVHPKYVPAAIYRVPNEHWKHHPHGVPPGQAKKYDEHASHEDSHGKDHDKHGEGDER